MKEYFIQHCKKRSLWGHKGVSIYDVFGSIIWDEVSIRSAAMAFNFFIAIFPGLLFFFTLIPYLKIEGLKGIVMRTMAEFLPHETMMALEESIDDLVIKEHEGVLSIGIVLLLFFAANGLGAALASFNKRDSANFKERNYFKERLMGLLLTLSIIILVVLSVALLIGGGHLIDYLYFNQLIEGAGAIMQLQITRWTAIFFIAYNIVSLVYFFGVSTTTKKTYFTIGGFYATILCMIVSLGFSYYINNFGQYNKLYGSIGTVIVVMLWLYFNSINLLIGFEVDTQIRDHKSTSDK